MANDEILVLESIHKSFNGTEVLKGIDLSVNRGEFITLLGSSGCGKTTTIRIIGGLEEPDSGKVLLLGSDITNLPPNERNVNTVFQNYALFPNMNVLDNIAYSLRLRRVPKEERYAKAKEMLSLVQLEGFEKRMPSELSGGQRQRIAIARALIAQPAVLLLDEPLGALDLKLRRQMQLELKRLQQKLGTTFIYITHDQEEAINMSTRIAVMNRGVFEQIGTPDEIYYHPRTGYVANFVGNANIFRSGETVFAIRTENVLIEGEPECRFPCTVKEKSFAGGQLRILVELDDGQQITVSRFGINSELEPGIRTKVGWKEADAVEVLCDAT